MRVHQSPKDQGSSDKKKEERETNSERKGLGRLRKKEVLSSGVVGGQYGKEKKR